MEEIGEMGRKYAHSIRAFRAPCNKVSAQSDRKHAKRSTMPVNITGGLESRAKGEA
jgi:hypothetical protein